MIDVVISAESWGTGGVRALAAWTTFIRARLSGRRAEPAPQDSGCRPAVCHDRPVHRSGTVFLRLLAPALLRIHLHHHFRGPPFDYVGLAIACFASWVGVPGPGEPLLLAAAVLAGQHRLQLGAVLGVAFLAAVAGGIAGWAIGLAAGRRVATAPGPLRSLRIRMVERGEQIFERFPVTAILMTPAFVAGIHRVRPSVYQAVNILSAAAWTLVIGVGGYYIGPPVLDAIGDLGTGVSIAFGLVVVGLLVAEISRRYRRGYR
jgi:membrane protein DedA with SNARE-associated domain